jgi:hypothetical protein
VWNLYCVGGDLLFQIILLYFAYSPASISHFHVQTDAVASLRDCCRAILVQCMETRVQEVILPSCLEVASSEDYETAQDFLSPSAVAEMLMRRFLDSVVEQSTRAFEAECDAKLRKMGNALCGVAV